MVLLLLVVVTPRVMSIARLLAACISMYKTRPMHQQMNHWSIVYKKAVSYYSCLNSARGLMTTYGVRPCLDHFAFLYCWKRIFNI